MSCYLLHVLEHPDPDPYRDEDLKDLVGSSPSFYCAHCQPLRHLAFGEAVKCIGREAPCWKPADRICEAS